MKFKLLCIMLIALSVGLVTQHRASALYGVPDCVGYFNAGDRGCPRSPSNLGRRVLTNGVPANDVGGLVALMTQALQRGGRDQVGASFVVNTMLGNNAPGAGILAYNSPVFGDWVNRVTAYANAGLINFNYDFPYTINSSLFKSVDDAEFWPSSGSAASIVFYSPGRASIIYVLKRDCANPLGGPAGGGGYLAPLDQAPVGSTSGDCHAILFNAWDPDTLPGSITVNVYINGAYMGTYPTDANHNGSFPIPAGYQGFGQFAYAVYANPGNAGGSGSWLPQYGGSSSIIGPCYNASCAGTAQVNDGNIVKVGTSPSPPFHVIGTFNNIGGMEWGPRITAKSSVYNTKSFSGAVPAAPPGSSNPITFGNWTSPQTLAHQSFTLTLYLDGSHVLATCPVDFDPYVDYTLALGASQGTFTPDEESPTSFKFTSSVNSVLGHLTGISTSVIHGPTYGLAVTRNGATVASNGGGDYTANGTDPKSLTYAISGGVVAGDKFCGTINIPTSIGFVNRLGATADNGGPPLNGAPDCPSVSDRPYFRVYGNDVSAGGGFMNGSDASACTNSGEVQSYFDNSVKESGSAVQIGSISFGANDGFGSASLRTTDPKPATGLTFANTTGGYGGSLGGQHCVPDYFATSATTTTTPLPAAIPTSGSAAYTKTGGLTVGAPVVIQDGARVTVYVTGDVVISSNITYQNTSWANQAAIPAFYLIVKGNIYIGPGVTQLDGVYIAQGTSGNGEINTCANGGAAFDSGFSSALYDNCKTQLTVNGSFIADKIFLNRTFGSIRSSVTGENKNSAPHNCGPGLPSKSDCSAEIFNPSVEMYLAAPTITVPTTNKYDYITSLSPVL
ncbi:MAG: exported protein of unknown function [Candidatus Saccharibacteria bacterium]|nr:exported protein of unknown function [Candidatus Saccharibacteria bacterium]